MRCSYAQRLCGNHIAGYRQGNDHFLSINKIRTFFTCIKGQGRSGLSLPAAAGIVRAHGGYLQVQSKVGQDSAFKIHLPIS
jgi:signal transduction histidine kinase